jgi:hypothetical protein
LSFSRSEGASLKYRNPARQKELLRQFLVPLLPQIRWRDDEDAPLALRPALRDHQASLDGLAEADLVREKRAARER